MGNIIDYVKEFRSYDFTQKAFDAVDGLVLACFSYFNFDHMVPGIKDESENVSIHDLSMNEKYDILFNDTFLPWQSKELFEAMLHSKRFGNLKMNYYVNEHDEKEQKQFSAISIFIDNFIYVAFRGTDKTFIGWKENFNMSYIPIIPSQFAAEIYLNNVALLTKSQLYLGGHSKGGNLAIYCATHCSQDIADRIIAIYSYDAPGFKEDIHVQDGYLKVVDRIQKYVPKSSIIGLLLQQEEDYFIVESDGQGILQHDAFTWIVKDGDFVYQDNLKEDALNIDRLLNNWIQNISDEDRKHFVDMLYEIITQNDIKTITEFKLNWKNIAALILVGIKGMTKDTRKVVTLMVRDLFWRMIKA